jgi:uncharacterized membrane protein
MKTLIIYGITTVVFFAIDMLWLGLIAKNFYREKLGFILSPDVNWYAAVIFYLIYIGGILYFAVLPAMKDESWQTALIQGAVLGFLCYATYDLTNMATIKNWPLTVVLVDIVWGIVLTGSCALISYLVATKFLA